MMQWKRVPWIAGLALAGALTTGCESEVVVPVEPETGTLTVLWSLDGTTDPLLCYDYGLGPTDFELLLYRGTYLFRDVYAPCEDFGLTVTLPSDRYTGIATLVEPDNDPVTTSLTLEDLIIVGGTDLTVEIDFPPGSVL